MTLVFIERVLWGGTLVAALGAVALLHTVRDADARASGASIIPLAETRTRGDSAALEEATATAIDLDLFRPDRRPAEAHPVSPSAPPGFGLPSVPSSRPRLQLRGLVGGPPWDAVIDGVPGREGGVLIRSGQSLAGLTVRAIRGDTVFVRGFDTTWALRLVRP